MKVGMLMCSSLAKITVCLALVLVMCGCSPMIHHQGKNLEEDDLAQVKTGIHTKEDVTRILGSPSSMAAFDDSKWYYIYKRTEATAFFKPKITQQKITEVAFDKIGRVEEVKHLDLSNAQDVAYVERITPTSGHSGSFLKQIFGNFGRVARQDGAKAPQ